VTDRILAVALALALAILVWHTRREPEPEPQPVVAHIRIVDGQHLANPVMLDEGGAVLKVNFADGTLWGKWLTYRLEGAKP